MISKLSKVDLVLILPKILPSLSSTEYFAFMTVKASTHYFQLPFYKKINEINNDIHTT